MHDNTSGSSTAVNNGVAPLTECTATTSYPCIPLSPLRWQCVYRRTIPRGERQLGEPAWRTRPCCRVPETVVVRNNSATNQGQTVDLAAAKLNDLYSGCDFPRLAAPRQFHRYCKGHVPASTSDGSAAANNDATNNFNMLTSDRTLTSTPLATSPLPLTRVLPISNSANPIDNVLNPKPPATSHVVYLHRPSPRSQQTMIYPSSLYISFQRAPTSLVSSAVVLSALPTQQAVPFLMDTLLPAAKVAAHRPQALETQVWQRLRAWENGHR